MKKKKCYMIVILLLSFIFIGEVKAESYIAHNMYTTISTDGFSKDTEVSFETYKSIDMRFNRNIPYSLAYFNVMGDGVVIEKNANAFTFPFAITDLEHNSQKMTCNTYTSIQSTYTISYQTLYADGTTSQNDGVINENIGHSQFCSGFNINNNNDYSITIGYKLNDNTKYNCMVTDGNNSSVALCPISNSRADGNYRITQIYFVFTRLNTDTETKIRVTFPTNIMHQINLEQSILDSLNEIKNKQNEMQNSDISNESKESPNTDDYDDYQTAENSLFDKMEQADTSNLNVAIDGNSANFVWNTITRFYNSNALLMNFLISILSIGIIKMALGR